MAGAPDPSAGSLADPCQALVRQGDRDRYFATLFAPADQRPALFALYAFNLEVARVRELVSDPLPGEIRLQWWRDLLSAPEPGAAAGHPVAQALLTAILRYRLPRSALIAITEARIFDLYDDPMPTLADLEGYGGETSSALIRLASLILAGGEDPGAADAAGHAGLAIAFTGLCRIAGRHGARGQVFVPGEILERHGARPEDFRALRPTPEARRALAELRGHARRHLARFAAYADTVTPAILPAFLPVALVGPALARLERTADPFRPTGDLTDWQRIALMAWRAWRGFR